jgi:glycerol-3-phosphate acyltransferase PlsX
MNIAVDAMGGDYAPEVVVQGALRAARQLAVEITLVGREKAVREVMGRNDVASGIHVLHCDDVVRMHEIPIKAVRRKKDASIRVAFEHLRSGRVDAVVSAGNSGAAFAAGLLTMGKIKGIERPALAGVLPGERGPVILLDVGANVDCRPAHLFQFGIMAQAYGTACLGMTDPKIGLLNIGEEGVKGNELVRSAHELFTKSSLNFVGNVEGRDVLTGNVQIVVSDGFVGNIALKLLEGMANAVNNMVQSDMKRSFGGRLGLFFGRRALRTFGRRLDYEEYGGAPILGIKGVGIVCHGSSSPRAIQNAIKMAVRYVEQNFTGRLATSLAGFGHEYRL